MAKTQASISKIQSPMKGLSKVFGAVIGGITTVSIARAIKSVSILVLLEVLLQHIIDFLAEPYQDSFNPCFTGSPTSTYKISPCYRGLSLSFNPCFTGSPTSTSYPTENFI